MRGLGAGGVAVLLVAGLGAQARAQAISTAPPAGPAAPATAPPAMTPTEAAQLRQQLQALRTQAKAIAEQANALEARLDAASPKPAPVAAAPPPPVATIASADTSSAGGSDGASLFKPKTWGELIQPGKGFVIAKTDRGELDASIITYVRYLNQTNLAPTYTNYFGKTTVLDLKEDVQINKINVTFKGWVYDPKFQYLIFLWTNNAAQGEQGQLAIGGFLNYRFADALALGAGVDSVPSTRSTTGNYPNWLRNDNRLMADEFFRGSFTEGIWLDGAIGRFQYRVMVADNLSILGVSASQLAPGLNTYSGYLRWMPTTGEFGPRAGFGDFEDHKKVATLLETHFTWSREDAQEQPGTDSIENSQIRLSDGERLFDHGVFGTPYSINVATYKMAAFDAAVKYRGFALESEYYMRWVDDFKATGPLPYNSMYDTGVSLQASAMVLQKKLQAYTTFSHIWGQFGSPNEAVFGLNWYPLDVKWFRLTPNAMWFNHVPIGYNGVPWVVGGQGWAFYLDAALALN